MKQSVFDLKLYREGLRQTRYLGILFTVIMSLLCLYNTIWSGAEALNEPVFYINQDASSVLTILVLSFILAAPFLSLRLFGFVNYRQTSDFYHALPQRRLSLYFSFMAAIASWLFLMIFVTTLLTSLSTLLFPMVYQISWGEYLVFAAAMWITALYIAGATVCAISLSGTYFSNIIIALLLIFGPRLALRLLGTITTMDIGAISLNYVRFPLAPQANLATLFVQSMFNSTDLNRSAYFEGRNILYTLGLALFFTALGACFFRIRKSETAGRAALSPGLGTAVRLAVSFFPCIYGISQIYGLLSGQSYISWVDGYSERFNLTATIASFLLGILVYFSYELLASRRISALKRALPGLALLPLICALALGGMMMARKSIISYRPAADEIKYVRILDKDAYNQYYSIHHGFSKDSYFDNRLAQIKLEDAFVRELTARSLTEVLDGKWNSYAQEVAAMTVAFNTGNGERIRKIIMTAQDAEKLWDKVAENEAYRKVWQDLPEESIGGFSIYAYNMSSRASWAGGGEVLAAMKRVYACLRQEAAAMDFESWTEALDAPSMEVDRLEITLTRGGISEGFSLSISDRLPQTMALYFKEMEALRSTEKILEQAREVIRQGGSYRMQLDLTVCESEDDIWSDYRVLLSERALKENEIWFEDNKLLTPEDTLALLDHLEGLDPPSPGRVMICIRIDAVWFTPRAGGYYDCCWVSADTLPDFLQEWKKQWENLVEWERK